MRVLGVDPGASGGLGLIAPEGPTSLPMPDKISSALKLLLPLDLAIVELVHAMPGQGVTSCFSFGMAYGRVLEALEALNVPYRLVDPKAWHKSVLGTPVMPSEWSRAERRKEWKRLACERVHGLWPAHSLKASKRCTTDHDGMADALCLAYYGLIESSRTDDLG